MDGIREYLIGVLAAALLCTVVSMLLDPKSAIGMCVKLLSGFLMLLSVLRPWVSFRPEGLFSWMESLDSEGASYVAQGQNQGKDLYRDSIKQALEAYILDEVRRLECQLTVEVILSEEELPIPRQVRLTGDISPYNRQKLSNFLSEQLGVAREEQIWT